MSVNMGDLLFDLLFPQHVVEYVGHQDKAMLKARLMRETYGFVNKNSSNADIQALPPLLITAGSRATSLRTPSMLAFNDAEDHVLCNDVDFMVIHENIVVGKKDNPICAEFIKSTENIGYGKIRAMDSLDKQNHLNDLLFCFGNGVEGKHLSGLRVMDYVMKSYRDNYESRKLQEWQRTGPAFERLNISDGGKFKQIKKADIVITVISAKDYFKEEKAEVMKKSLWSPQIRDAVLSSPISFVQVAPKTCKDPGIMWRVSFSMHELIIAQSLDFHQRQIYMVIKYVTKYLTGNTHIPENIAFKDVSSYMTMNAYFAFCDQNPSKNWHVNKLETVLEFFRHFAGTLSAMFLPQYLLPLNNLLSEVTPEWCKFYTEMFSFGDETTLVELLLNIQCSWRMVQFDRCIQTHWSGDNLTVNEANSMLMKISMDAVVHLEPVRAVQALGNHFMIYLSNLCHEGLSSHDDRQVKLLQFWNSVFKQMKSLVETEKVSHVKYLRLLKLMRKMIPLAGNDYLSNLFQQEMDIQDSGPLHFKTDSEPYFTVKYEKHGEMDDCVIEYNDDNIIVNFMHAKDTKYVFPYTDYSLLFSEPLLYFIVCQQALQTAHNREVESAMKDLPQNVPEMRDHPLVALICVLRNILFDDVTFPDFTLYKVNEH